MMSLRWCENLVRQPVAEWALENIHVRTRRGGPTTRQEVYRPPPSKSLKYLRLFPLPNPSPSDMQCMVSDPIVDVTGDLPLRIVSHGPAFPCVDLVNRHGKRVAIVDYELSADEYCPVMPCNPGTMTFARLFCSAPEMKAAGEGLAEAMKKVVESLLELDYECYREYGNAHVAYTEPAVLAEARSALSAWEALK